MDLQRFKLAKKMFEEKVSIDDSESDLKSVYEYLHAINEEPLNEGLFSGIFRWYKLNFSSRALKMKKMGAEYFDWLMKEYKSTYKKDKWNDTPLESFLKRETPSSDIEQQLKELAKDDAEYLTLAKQIILENRIKAKKTFCQEQLGADDKLTRHYAEEEVSTTKDVKRTLAKMSRKDAGKFEFYVNELKDRIREDGKNLEIAAKLASGISMFAQNRKLRYGTDFTAEDLFAAYDNAEKEYLRANPDMNDAKGAEYLYSIRCAKTPEMLKLETLSAEDIKRQVDKIRQALEEIGVDTENDEHWGLIELYLMQRDLKSQQDVLELIREKVTALSAEDLNDFSNDVETELGDITSKNMTPDEEQSAVDTLETKLKGTKPKNAETSEKPVEEKPVEEKPVEEKPAEEPAAASTGLGEVGQKLTEEIKARPVHLLEGIKDYLFAVASATKKGEKFVWNPAAKRTFTAIKSGLNDPNNGIPAELVEQAQLYMRKNSQEQILFPAEWERSDMLTQEIFNKCLDDTKFKKATESLFSDYSTGLSMWNESLEKSDNDTQKELTSKAFFAALFKDKKGFEEPLEKEKVKELMGETFSYYL
jgi:hypothetical protein